MSPQARGSAGGRRRHDPASQEDHDKPYVCDSKYRQCRIPSPGPAPSLTFPCAPLTVSPQSLASWLLLWGLHSQLTRLCLPTITTSSCSPSGPGVSA